MVAGPLAPVGESKTKDYDAFVTPTLLESAQANPDKLFHVIVQGDGSRRSAFVTRLVAAEAAKGSGSTSENRTAYRRQLRAQFTSVARPRGAASAG